MYVDPSGNNPSLNEEVISLTMATLLSVSVGLCLRNLMVACINMRDQMNFPDVGTTVEILKNKMVGIQKDFASGWEILWVPEVIKETIIDGIPAKVQEVMIEVFPAIKQEVMIEVFPATKQEGLLIIPGPYVVERNFWDNFTVNMRKDILESGLESINSLDDLLTNPDKLSGVSGEELYNYLVKNGYDVKTLSQGSFKGIPFEEGGGFKVNWGGDRILQYHPENLSHHGGAYFKISSGKTGTIRIDLDGNLID